MPSFLRTRSADNHIPARRTSAAPSHAPREPKRAAPKRAAQDGFALIEVLVTSLIVGLIVVGTFTGFGVAGDKTADQRRRSQATELAAESQEQLRSDSASALEGLENTPHSYTETLNGTTYTITESTKYINDATQGTTCTSPSSSEASKTSSSYLQIESLVKWTARETSPEVEQTSIVTPPTGSSIELEALNGASPEEGVSGVASAVEYTGVESTAPTTVEGTTGSLGCVVFGAIPATSATFTLKPPLGYVTPAGVFTFSPEPLTLAPNITTHKSFLLGDGGTIKGEFTYNNATTYEGKAVQGETFVAFNTKMGVAPEFTLASPNPTYEASGEQKYTPASSGPASSVETPHHSPGYPTGDLFPWPSRDYVVYAGDCTANNVTTGDYVEALVKPGAVTTVQVPLSRVVLNVYSGTSTSSALTTEKLPVQITDTGCSSVTPNNATKGLYVHTQTLSGSGHLENQFQPYGSYSLCVYSAVKKANYTVSYKNETMAGSTRNILLGEAKTVGEQTYAANPTTPC